MEPGSEIIRPAGLLEQYHITRCSLDFDSCVISAAQYISNDGQDLDQAALFRSLGKVVDSHPALGVCLVEDSLNKTSFGRLKQVSLSKVVEFSGGHDLQAVIEEQLARGFVTSSLTLPLWRLVVLKNNTVCFVWHHCIGDGTSGLAFHHALLNALQETENQKFDAQDIVTPSTNEMVPAIETVLDITPSWCKVISEVFRSLVPVAWTRDMSTWTGNPVSRDASLQTRVRLFEVTPDDAAALLTICRYHDTTMTAAFHTLAMATLSSSIPMKNYTRISSCVPISLRSVAGTTNDVFCDYVSVMQTYPHINSTFSWRDASQYASRIRSYRAKSGQAIGMLKFLFGNYTSYFTDMVGKKRKVTLEISNVGRFDLASTGQKSSAWTIGHTVFAQCNIVTGPAFTMSVVGNPLGGINVAVTWGAGVISDSIGEVFLSRFKTGVKQLLITDAETISFGSLYLEADT